MKGTNNQVLYTRAGNFTMDQNGYICTQTGERVQGQNGEIQIPRNTAEIQVSKTGEILADGKSLGKLQVVMFDHNQSLQREGANRYSSQELPHPAKSAVVNQGFLEHSNANVVTEMVNSISGLRTYETLQKSIEMQNQTLSKSVNDVGRLM